MRAQAVYVMEADGRFKVGISQDPSARLAQLRTGSPKIRLVFQSEPLKNASKVESAIHMELMDFREASEWFDGLTEDEVLEIVMSAMERVGALAGKDTGDDGAFGRGPHSIQCWNGKFLEVQTLEELLWAWTLVDIGYDYDEVKEAIEKMFS